LDAQFAQLLPEVMIGITPQRLAAIASAALAPKPVPVVMTDHVHTQRVSVREHMAIIRDRLRRQGSTTFRSLVAECTTTLEVVARFLGLLELYRDGVIAFDQAAALAELRVRWTGPPDETAHDGNDDADGESVDEEYG
jgi:segregation and condensation protein A